MAAPMPVPTFMNSVPVSHPGASTGPHRGSPPKASSPPKPGSPPKVNGHAVNGVKPAVVPAGVPTAAGAAAAAAARAEALAASAKSRPPHRRRRVSKDMQRLLKPKKNGAGGRGVWGRPGDELLEDDLDENDPNYVPDEDADADTSFFMDRLTINAMEPIMKAVRDTLLEYFDTFDRREVFRALTELNVDGYEPEVIVLLISLGMDRNDTARELVSTLLAELNGQVFRAQDIQRGFDLLLERADDLAVDTPKLADLLGRFLARAVADEALPPKYIMERAADPDLSPAAAAAVKEAQVLLNVKHGLARLSEIWGNDGGRRPVMQLSRKIDMIIQEYLSSRDLAEARRCLTELDVPHFHHELVYDAIVYALEGNDAQRERLLELLQYLGESVAVTSSQIAAGFERVFANISDIALDVPNAHKLLAQFVDKAVAFNIISSTVAAELPERGRRRMLSNGSGENLA